MRYKFAGLIAIGLFLSIAIAPRVSAHVLVTDKVSNSSAVVHITPDDDPEAGKPADFYFELQTSVSPTTFSEYRLYITDENDVMTTVPLNTNSHSMAGSYTFPTQGLYRLELKSINPWKQSFDLKYSLRVSRGVAGGAAMQQRFGWVQPTFIATAVITGLLLITFVNNFRQIFKHSTF